MSPQLRRAPGGLSEICGNMVGGGDEGGGGGELTKTELCIVRSGGLPAV